MLHRPRSQGISETGGRRRNFAPFTDDGRVAFELVVAQVDASGANLMESGLQTISLNQIREVFAGALGQMKHLPVRMDWVIENDAPQSIEKHGLPILQLPPDQADTIRRRRRSREIPNSSGGLGEVRDCSEPS
jgi:hypothetical protein